MVFKKIVTHMSYYGAGNTPHSTLNSTLHTQLHTPHSTLKFKIQDHTQLHTQIQNPRPHSTLHTQIQNPRPHSTLNSTLHTPHSTLHTQISKSKPTAQSHINNQIIRKRGIPAQNKNQTKYIHAILPKQTFTVYSHTQNRRQYNRNMFRSK